MEIRERANQASLILDNPIFKDSLQHLKETIIHEWSISEYTEDREKCWMKLDAIRSIEEELTSLIQNYKIEITEGK